MTHKYRVRKNWLATISTALWMGLCGFLIVWAISHSMANSFAKQLLDLFIPIASAYIVGLIAVIFIREKLRNTIWIANVLLCSLFFNHTFTYIVLGCYALDEFIICPLYRHYKQKYIINREIDARTL